MGVSTWEGRGVNRGTATGQLIYTLPRMPVLRCAFVLCMRTFAEEAVALEALITSAEAPALHIGARRVDVAAAVAREALVHVCGR